MLFTGTKYYKIICLILLTLYEKKSVISKLQIYKIKTSGGGHVPDLGFVKWTGAKRFKGVPKNSKGRQIYKFSKLVN